MRFRRRLGVGPSRATTAALAAVAAATLIAAYSSGSSSSGPNILDLENAPNYWIDAINGAVILVALILARVIGGEASAE